MLALIIQRIAKGAEEIRIVHGQPHLGQPRLVQYGEIAVVAVAAKDELIHRPDPPDRMGDLADRAAIYPLERPAVINLLIIQRAQGELKTHLAWTHHKRLPDILAVPAKP